MYAFFFGCTNLVYLFLPVCHENDACCLVAEPVVRSSQRPEAEIAVTYIARASVVPRWDRAGKFLPTT